MLGQMHLKNGRKKRFKSKCLKTRYKKQEDRVVSFTRGKKEKGSAFATICTVFSKQLLKTFRGCKSCTRIKRVSWDVFLCVAGDRNCFMQYHKD